MLNYLWVSSTLSFAGRSGNRVIYNGGMIDKIGIWDFEHNTAAAWQDTSQMVGVFKIGRPPIYQTTATRRDRLSRRRQRLENALESVRDTAVRAGCGPQNASDHGDLSSSGGNASRLRPRHPREVQRHGIHQRSIGQRLHCSERYHYSTLR